MSVGIAIQLNPPIRLYTVKGPGYAHIFSQFGPESDQQWTVFLDNGEVWDMPNYRVRAQDNFSLGRSNPGLKEKIQDNPLKSRPCECSVIKEAGCTVPVDKDWSMDGKVFYHCRRQR